MAPAIAYPAQLGLSSDRHMARWRPLVNWLLAIPQFMIANALNSLRNVLTLIAFFTVLFTRRIPRPVFDAICMTYRYDWRTISYALFLREDYPPFDFDPASGDNGRDPRTALSVDYPEQLGRWHPLFKWFLAIPHYVVLAVLALAAAVVIVIALFAVLFTGAYPAGLRDFVVGVYRYSVRVEAYVGLLTDRYPPFSLAE